MIKVVKERVERVCQGAIFSNIDLINYVSIKDDETDVPILDSVIDFKHFFTVNNENLKRLKPENYIGKIAELYREQVSHRFASYLSRIGLPNKEFQ